MPVGKKSRGSCRKNLSLHRPRTGAKTVTQFPCPVLLPFPVLEEGAAAGISAPARVREETTGMAMFEQMRANVGKLLKGIDRSEPGRRERFWSNGVEGRVSGDSKG